MNWTSVLNWGVGIMCVALILGYLQWFLRIRAWNRRWSARPPMSDDEFIAACNLPGGGMAPEVAKFVRADLAKAAGLPSSQIRPDDPLRHPAWVELLVNEDTKYYADHFGVVPDLRAITAIIHPSKDRNQQATVSQFIAIVVAAIEAGKPVAN